MSPQFQDSPPTLSPVDAERRPAWSVIIPIYQRTTYLEQCLKSVVDQSGGPGWMEIFVQDDCSAEDYRPLVNCIAQGKAIFGRNANRRGLYGNVNDVLARTSGHFIHVLHEDDFIEPGFYKLFESAFKQLPSEVGVAFCHYTNLNVADETQWSPPAFRASAGRLSNWLERVAVQNPLNVPAVVYRRSVFEQIGLYKEDLPYTADWEFYVRAAASFDWWYQPENLARFRIHSASATAELTRQGQTVVDVRRMIQLFETYLPDSVIQRVLPVARQVQGRAFLIMAFEALKAGDSELGNKILVECLRLGGSVSESVEFAQVLQHPALDSLRRDLAQRWRDGDIGS